MHVGLQTGDLVVAPVPRGKYAGVRKGRVSTARRPPDITVDGQRVAHVKMGDNMNTNAGPLRSNDGRQLAFLGLKA